MAKNSLSAFLTERFLQILFHDCLILVCFLQPLLFFVSCTSAFVLAARGVELVAHSEFKHAAVAPTELFKLGAVKKYRHPLFFGSEQVVAFQANGKSIVKEGFGKAYI